MEDQSRPTGLVKTNEKAVFFPDQQFVERATFLKKAFGNNPRNYCTLDRKNEESRNKEILKNYPPKEGYDIVQWPMAICKEGGSNAYVEYILSSINKDAEEWLENELSKYPDGKKLFFNLGIPPKLNNIVEKEEE
ncbi:hypothetical protein EDD58_103419 [Hazenella coriacea]|uniref:Uncharacterized protein n=2 Tax=Hazenella coriacea TaxID=1179467 RepID=A0A4R3L9T4_9BACL|nr:hypothetical protein EDD58_103419 [Hazenella coriacea]